MRAFYTRITGGRRKLPVGVGSYASEEFSVDYTQRHEGSILSLFRTRVEADKIGNKSTPWTKLRTILTTDLGYHWGANKHTLEYVTLKDSDGNIHRFDNVQALTFMCETDY